VPYNKERERGGGAGGGGGGGGGKGRGKPSIGSIDRTAKRGTTKENGGNYTGKGAKAGIRGNGIS